MGTSIEWTDESWNPVTGCSHVSEGCRNCYAERLALRKLQPYDTGLPWTKQNAKVNVKLHPERLGRPLRWRKPRRVFVNSMSDLFHERVPVEFIDRVFASMALCPRHTFQILTKRPVRMLAYVHLRQYWSEMALPNVHRGVSVENQETADERIPLLLKTPASVRFVSAEPLLGPIDLSPYIKAGIDQVIVGGESGPGARPMHPEWARSIRDLCLDTDAAFFMKQMAKKAPIPNDLMVREYPKRTHRIPNESSNRKGALKWN